MRSLCLGNASPCHSLESSQNTFDYRCSNLPILVNFHGEVRMYRARMTSPLLHAFASRMSDTIEQSEIEKKKEYTMATLRLREQVALRKLLWVGL